MGQSFRVVLGAAASIMAFAGAAHALNELPSQAGRLAFTEGTVSFHDDEQAGWSPAVINTPLTSGNSVWTEPNARSEISIAGSRVRMDGSTQLNMLAVDDSQTRLQVGQGRVDIKTFALDPNMAYQVVTPRGTMSLRQQGDYYVEAGSTQDATRLGVRSGAAQFKGLNGQTLTVNSGQVGEIFGDTGALQLRTINSAPPAQPVSWAARDRQINYDLPTQYLSAGITGYEDLNSYGSWSNDSQYGNVWTPRSVPSGWQPYKNGHWSYVKPWGWTWIDDQPWGYASSHYGRWANRNNQWVWVPPQREAQQVYAPALVAFVGGLELVQAVLGGNTSLANQNSAPVGWFPLAPREAYVPSYSTDRAYYSRLNTTNQVQEQILEDRWQRAQRREAYLAGQNSVLANQRFATVVPAEVFVRSQPVARAVLPVSAAQIVAVPVSPVSAPPAPTASIARLAPASSAPASSAPASSAPASPAPVSPAPVSPAPVSPAPASAPAGKTADPAVPAARTAAPAPIDPKAEADAKAKAEAQARLGAAASLPVAKTAVADMPTLAKPTATTQPPAPGPKLATAPNTPATTANTEGKTAAPPLVPRSGAAPPILKDDNKAPAQPAPGTPQAKAPAASDTRTPTAPSATAPMPAKPEAATKPAEPLKPVPAPVQQQAKPESPVKPAEPPHTATPGAATPGPATPGNDNKASDKGAAVTPQHAAPAAPTEQKQAVPNVMPAPKTEPPAPPPHVATPVPPQGPAPALPPIAAPPGAPQPVTPPHAAAPTSIAPPPAPRAAHEEQKPRHDPDTPAVTDEKMKNEKK